MWNEQKWFGGPVYVVQKTRRRLTKRESDYIMDVPFSNRVMKVRLLQLFTLHLKIHHAQLLLVQTKEGMTLNEKLEYAYRWTQNIMDSWSLKMPMDGNDDVTVMGELHVDENGQKWGIAFYFSW